MFEDFDFMLLADPAFKEDSVREELILPVLKRLGYSVSPPNQICRSVGLVHPFVYIGSQKKKISIFPDYLIKKNNENFFILDAKNTNENIANGKNVEQAYSYAIHKDVRVNLFALCNGHELALFHVSSWPELLRFPLRSIDEHWKVLANHIGCDAVRRDATFRPDLGIGMLRLGLAAIRKDAKLEKVTQLFSSIEIFLAAKVDDELYSIQSHIEFEKTVFLATFDFKKSLFEKFIDSIEPVDLRAEIKQALQNNPFIWHQTSPLTAMVGLVCRIADNVFSNEDEQYLPFEVEAFIKKATPIN